MNNYVDKYTLSEELLIFIGSWNAAGGKEFNKDVSLLEWLTPKNVLYKTPDIYCIGLQEIVPLNAGNILIQSNAAKVEYWRSSLKSNLDAIDKYVFIIIY